jgi:hypothetical protein
VKTQRSLAEERNRMGNQLPKEEQPDAPEELKRRMPPEVHGSRRHGDFQVYTLTKLQEIRKQEVLRKEDIVSPGFFMNVYSCLI